MILSHQTIAELCSGDRPLINPFKPEKVVINGKSSGNSSASYDCCIDHDLVLGVNPAFIIRDHVLQYGFSENALPLLQEALRNNPPMQALAYTVEDFCIPAFVSGAVCDKSSYARVFVSAFNTFFDPGFHGNATLELVNHGEEPISLKKGDPVCQFLFSLLDKPTVKPYAGKYQHQTKAAHGARYELEGGGYKALEAPKAALPPPPTLAEPEAPHCGALFERNERQEKVGQWVERIWGRAALHPHERVERLVEEVFELAQAEGVKGGLLAGPVALLLSRLRPYQLDPTTSAMIREVQYALDGDRLSMIATKVYQKSPGALAQEVGGIGTCLLAYCEGRGLSADFCERAELERILALPDDHFRMRHAAKIQSGLALKLIDEPAA